MLPKGGHNVLPHCLIDAGHNAIGKVKQTSIMTEPLLCSLLYLVQRQLMAGEKRRGFFAFSMPNSLYRSRAGAIKLNTRQLLISEVFEIAVSFFCWILIIF